MPFVERYHQLVDGQFPASPFLHRFQVAQKLPASFPSSVAFSARVPLSLAFKHHQSSSLYLKSLSFGHRRHRTLMRLRTLMRPKRLRTFTTFMRFRPCFPSPRFVTFVDLLAQIASFRAL